jgi:hypothetical protein
MSLIDHPISQPKVDMSPIWTPVITAEVREPLLRPVWIVCLCWYHREISDYVCSDSTRVLGLVRVEFLLFLIVLTLADSLYGPCFGAGVRR